jgi:hypothetical protein
MTFRLSREHLGHVTSAVLHVHDVDEIGRIYASNSCRPQREQD